LRENRQQQKRIATLKSRNLLNFNYIWIYLSKFAIQREKIIYKYFSNNLYAIVRIFKNAKLILIRRIFKRNVNKVFSKSIIETITKTTNIY